MLDRVPSKLCCCTLLNVSGVPRPGEIGWSNDGNRGGGRTRRTTPAAEPGSDMVSGSSSLYIGSGRADDAWDMGSDMEAGLVPSARLGAAKELFGKLGPVGLVALGVGLELADKGVLACHRGSVPVSWSGRLVAGEDIAVKDVVYVGEVASESVAALGTRSVSMRDCISSETKVPAANTPKCGRSWLFVRCTVEKWLGTTVSEES